MTTRNIRRALRIILLEPYFTGSHADWARGFAAHSRHQIEVLSLPGQFWKWRMQGGAISLARLTGELRQTPDLIIASDMLDLPRFTAFAGPEYARIRKVMYFHENQLSYPFPPGEKRDLHYGFINYSSALHADHNWFNSRFHRDDFLAELPRLLKHYADFNELWSVEAIREKSSVLSLGLDLRRFDPFELSTRPPGPLRILWNHRWEYDKGPEAFFEALYALAARGMAFQVILLGECFRQRPEEFLEARERLGERVIQFGYAESFDAYARWLWLADVQVSCASQDFFGAATVEAMYCGCLPLLPKRLNYPDLIPREASHDCLYSTPKGLIERLAEACSEPERTRRHDLRAAAKSFDWGQLIERYDDACWQVYGSSAGSGESPADSDSASG